MRSESRVAAELFQTLGMQCVIIPVAAFERVAGADDNGFMHIRILAMAALDGRSVAACGESLTQH
jgi:hypothetical protein